MTTPICIMSGGRGMRLKGLTKDRPKGLVKVRGEPMLETIIRDYREQGFKKIWLALGYRAQMIQDYFGDGSKFGVKISYVHETEPLGTAGALNLLPMFDQPYIVSNCDVMVSPAVPYGRLMESHANSGADATVCLALYQEQIDYGVAEIDGDRLIAIREKPILEHLIAGGIYVINPGVVQLEGQFDMPELLESLDTLGHFSIEGQWYDVADWEDVARVNGEWGQ